ncbi:MAG: hypothetical protein IT406_00120, partial [Candidatus Yanofskybacteria bacterium]|nr:hypothetical protein [Candidatus Yanofskybacteria bacterium]
MSNTIKGAAQRTLAALTMATTVMSLAGFAAFPLTAAAVAPADFGLKEGDVIRATGDVDLYIVNELGFKRLFVNPAIFNLYGHLGWSKVKEVSPATRDAFKTSGLFRNCESGDAKVYGLDVISEDVANLRWVNTSGAQAVADDPNFFKKVFCINNAEMALYGSGAAYTSVLQVPDYSRQTGGTVSGAVSFSANANQGGSIIAGAAQVPVLNFRVTNSASGAVSLDMLKFTKTGVVSDANISNAYLSMGGKIVAQYSGLSGGVLSFSGTGIMVQPGQSVDLTLRVDVSSSTSNGNTVGFNLNAASDITLSGGASVGGSFPVVGGSYVTTSVSNPSLASIGSFAYQTVGSEVDAGTQAFRAGALSFTVSNNPVKVQSMRFTVSGSVTKSTDLKNAVLKVDGVQVASTAMIDGDYLYFDMGSNQPVLNTGTHQVEVYVDVLGTPNRTFKLEILRPYDWLVWDTQYNTNISGGTPSTGSATTVTVRAGTSTATLASDTPTGSLAKGASNVTIAKFRIYAAGEGLRIKWLPFQIDVTGSVSNPWTTTATTVDDDIRNISLTSDDGSQIGTTINTPSSCTYGTAISTATTYKCSFGSSTSNINYIIPANTARVLSLKLDVQSTPDDLKTIKGTLLAPANSVSWTGSNYEGQVSFATGSLPAGNIAGSILNISQSPFVAAKNSAVGTQTFVAGTNQAKLGSYSLSASNAEGINVTSVTILAYDANGTNLKVQNLRVKNGSTEWNFNVPTVTASSSYTFSSPSGPTLIPAGGSVVLDVYGDVLTNSNAG